MNSQVSLVQSDFKKIRRKYAFETHEKIDEYSCKPDIELLLAEAKRLTNMARWILEVCKKDFTTISSQKAIIKELIKRGYDPDPVKELKIKRNITDAKSENDKNYDEDDEEDEEEKEESFKYLLSIPVGKMNLECRDKFLFERSRIYEYVKDFNGTQPNELNIIDSNEENKEEDIYMEEEILDDAVSEVDIDTNSSNEVVVSFEITPAISVKEEDNDEACLPEDENKVIVLNKMTEEVICDYEIVEVTDSDLEGDGYYEDDRDINSHTQGKNSSIFTGHISKKSSRLIVDADQQLQILDEAKSVLRCQYCSRAFKHRSEKDRHEKIHTGEKPYKCDMCDHKSLQKSNLNRHLLNFHNVVVVQEKPTRKAEYKCSFCPKRFFHSSSLSRHERLHKNNYLVCSFCSKKCVDNTDYSRHLLSHTFGLNENEPNN